MLNQVVHMVTIGLKGLTANYTAWKDNLTAFTAIATAAREATGNLEISQYLL
jgi:hypothetical protein